LASLSIVVFDDILSLMRKKLFLLPLASLVFFLSGCSFKKSPSALQINSTPTANVFIDGKQVGKTPYQASNLSAGEVLIKLIPDTTSEPLVSWDGKIKLNEGVLTLIERDFASTEAGSSGQILTLEKTKNKKTASLSIVSDPDGSLVKIDGEAKGFTPLLLGEIGEGDHQIAISKDGFLEKIIKARAVLGYQLVVNAKLAQVSEGSLSLTPTPSRQDSSSTSSGRSNTEQEIAKPYVQIKDTPTGWLRVRMEPSTTATEAAKVNPGEKFPLLDEQSGWYKIRYGQNKEGWVSSQYATKYE